jgi:hypothetical protein
VSERLFDPRLPAKEVGRLCPHLGDRIRKTGKAGDVWWEPIQGEDLKTSNRTTFALSCQDCADRACLAGRSLSKQIEHERSLKNAGA